MAQLLNPYLLNITELDGVLIITGITLVLLLFGTFFYGRRP